MENKVKQYGDIFPGFTLRMIERDYGGKLQEDYQICKDDFPIFTFPIKPITQKKHLESTDCFTGWAHNAMNVSSKFMFRPSLGAEIFESINTDPDWVFNKEGKYCCDMGFFVFEKAGKLIENK
jgi:hypothetical protein